MIDDDDDAFLAVEGYEEETSAVADFHRLNYVWEVKYFQSSKQYYVSLQDYYSLDFDLMSELAKRTYQDLNCDDHAGEEGNDEDKKIVNFVDYPVKEPMLNQKKIGCNYLN